MTPPLWQKAKNNKSVSWWKWKKRVKKLAWSSTFRKLRSWHPVPSLNGTRWGDNGNNDRLYLFVYLFIYLAPKSVQMVTAAMNLKDACSLGKKAMTSLDSILKSRDITLLTKVHLVKATVFPVVMYGCENWSIKKAEHRRIDRFELWFWRRLLGVPWTARRSNKSILKEINPEYSLEG